MRDNHAFQCVVTVTFHNPNLNRSPRPWAPNSASTQKSTASRRALAPRPGSATAGVVTAAAPSSLDEVTCVQNVTWSISWGRPTSARAATNGWGADLATLKRGEFNLECVYDPADADMIALMGAFLTNSMLAFYIASGDKATSGTQGLWADFQVHTAAKTENLEEGQMITFTIKPTLSDVRPSGSRSPKP
jgi:hypothetical protein